jgi:hypothetical protein
MNKLFGIDIYCWHGRTEVTFWRHKGDGCTNQTLVVRSEATYARLFLALPESGWAIHPHVDYLAISAVGLDREDK